MEVKMIKSSMGRLMEDLTGRRFGRLTVLGPAPTPKEDKYRRPYWECKCDCGRVKAIAGQYLRSGSSKSCGCLLRQRRPKDIPAMRADIDKSHFDDDWMFLGQGDTLSLKRPLRTVNGDWI